MTARQREGLFRATDMGYFSVPREASLAEVAEDRNISDQALSERIRRGTYHLVRRTGSDDDGGPSATKRGSPRPDRDDGRGRGR